MHHKNQNKVKRYAICYASCLVTQTKIFNSSNSPNADLKPNECTRYVI